jgi:sigma-B regulation protein RsbU (phosphoserine phosphatase)
LLVLRDVTERKRDVRRLRDLLAERARVAETPAQSLRPLALPTVPGLQLAARYRPAGGDREVGGDFYDVHPVGDAWAFSLGDVSGKGATAAAATAFARYTLRAITRPGGSPSETLRLLNGLVAGQYGEETYLTVVHGTLRPVPDGVAVTLALGGHPHPLLVRPGGTVQAVGAPGSAVGLLPDPDFTDTEICLKPGDNLFLCTDGVGEARNGKTFFADSVLPDTIAGLAGCDPETVAETVLRRVLAFRSDGPADDIAILVLHAGPAHGVGPDRP